MRVSGRAGTTDLNVTKNNKMRYFTKEATLTYLTLTEVSFDNHLISEGDYYERLYLLKQFCDPNDTDTIANIEIHISDFGEWHKFDEITEYYADESNDTNVRHEDEKEGKASNSSNIEFQGDDFDPLLHFISATSGKISKWEFHKTDSDFFPSIPHGHAIINNKIKLDAYRGYIYNNNFQTDREKRQFIIDLWNDSKFRDSARETIIYYLNTFPHYNWRVLNPLRIPRRRR